MAKTKKNPEYNIFQQLIVDKLAKLGSSLDGMRKSLAKGKFTGEPEDAAGCPLANYLRDTFDDIDEISVAEDEVKVDGVTLTPPKLVTAFVEKFDQRKFLELINTDSLEENEVTTLAKQRKKK